MMCRYDSRALSASLMGNKSFRFRISALIWSRRALDAPLVERYIVPCCCGETGSEETRKKNSSGGESCESCALRSAARWNEVRLLCLRERQVVEVGKLSGALLDFHISRLGGFVFSPSPLKKEKKKVLENLMSCVRWLYLGHSVQLGWLAGRRMDGWIGCQSV